MIWIGTSGWQYDDWRGSFYPEGLPKRQWLEFYARNFESRGEKVARSGRMDG